MRLFEFVEGALGEPRGASRNETPQSNPKPIAIFDEHAPARPDCGWSPLALHLVISIDFDQAESQRGHDEARWIFE